MPALHLHTAHPQTRPITLSTQPSFHTSSMGGLHTKSCVSVHLGQQQTRHQQLLLVLTISNVLRVQHDTPGKLNDQSPMVNKSRWMEPWWPHTGPNGSLQNPTIFNWGGRTSAASGNKHSAQGEQARDPSILARSASGSPPPNLSAFPSQSFRQAGLMVGRSGQLSNIPILCTDRTFVSWRVWQLSVGLW